MPSNASRSTRQDRGTRVYSQLRELIIHGRLAPGAWIIETDIAARLGVSRTPVRAALQRLAQEGYIVGSVRGQQLRASVAPLTRGDARELFDIVGSIEGLAARRAAGLPDESRVELVHRLDELNTRFAGAGEDDSPDQATLFEVDTAFHLCYVDAGAGPRVHALHDAIKPQAERYIRLYYSALTSEVKTSAAEHDVIVRAIEAGGTEAAERAVQQNWRNAAERLSRVIDAVGERGSW